MGYSCISNKRVEKQIEDGLKIVQKFSWLLDSFVLDFYTENHWEKLPSKWQELFNDVNPKELGKLLEYRKIESGVERVWPLSFLALRSAAHQLSISRHQIDFLKGSKCHSAAGGDVLQSLSPTSNLFQSEVCFNSEVVQNPLSTLYEDPKFSHIFTKHVKPKKRHEVALMAKITSETARSLNCCYIVDVGSGVGHLARMLSYGYGLRVCCLETQNILSEQARKLDHELEMTANKYSDVKWSDVDRPVHLNITLNSSLDYHDFVQELKKAFRCPEDASFTFGIVGLHPCGDLGPILLHLLAKCPSAAFANIVGCCYMKLTTASNSSVHFKGYPLSNFVSHRPHTLSYEAREIACHAIENYSQRLCTGDISHLQVHSYRATLERLLMKHWPHLRHTSVRSIRHTKEMPFDRYCKLATERLGVQLSPEDLMSEETLRDLSQWKKVVIFYSLRLLVAPLVETVLLLDRVFYLQELGFKCWLTPVFDPFLSPRNHILVATKPADS